jgi:hypothetical protein
MVSRLQTLKLVLKQPKPASVFKFLNAIRPKSLADKVKDISRMNEMDPNAWTVKDVGDIAIWKRRHKERSPCGQLVSRVLVCYLLLCPVVVQGRVRQLRVTIADVQGT